MEYISRIRSLVSKHLVKDCRMKTLTIDLKTHKCSFCRKPEYLHVVNHSANAQLRGMKLTQ